MKVLFVSNIKRISGAELILLDFLRDNRQINPALLAPPDKLFHYAALEGIRVYQNNWFGELRRSEDFLWPLMFLPRLVMSTIRTVIALRKERPDLVDFNNFASAIYGFAPTKLFRRPMIWHIYDIFPPRSLESFVLRKMSRSVERVVAASEAVRNSLETAGVSAGKISVVYNGIDTNGRFNPERYDDVSRASALGLPLDSFVVGTMCQIVEWKGVHIFLDAIEQLVGQIPPQVRFVIVGDAPEGGERYKERLIRRVEQEPLSGTDIGFMGWRNDVPHVLRDMDVLVHSSIRPDPFPTVVLQAMAMRKLVIASATGGVPEMIEHRVHGVLYTPGNSRELAHRLKETIQGFDDLAQIRQNAREKVLAAFSEERRREAMLDLYWSLVETSHDRTHAG